MKNQVSFEALILNREVREDYLIRINQNLIFLWRTTELGIDSFPVRLINRSTGNQVPTMSASSMSTIEGDGVGVGFERIYCYLGALESFMGEGDGIDTIHLYANLGELMRDADSVSLYIRKNGSLTPTSTRVLLANYMSRLLKARRQLHNNLEELDIAMIRHLRESNDTVGLSKLATLRHGSQPNIEPSEEATAFWSKIEADYIAGYDPREVRYQRKGNASMKILTPDECG